MPAVDKFASNSEGMNAPCDNAEVVTASDTTELSSVSRALYVGTGGTISVLMNDGTTAVFKNVPSGSILPIRIRRVNSTGTVTAADLLALS